MTAAPDPAMVSALSRLGLIDKNDEQVRFEALTGGVSSDIWKVDTGEQTFCVKRALPKLKVKADWQAPIERNRFEVAWYQIANAICPGVAPRVLAHDPDAMLCAMEYLEPKSHKLWKTELRDGRADPQQAAECGRRLALIHAETADQPDVAERFPRSDIFHSIRLAPYLEATAERHPELRDTLFDLSLRTANTRRVMIHGDVSPKNILIGPNGPVLLDAECACIGDPAFDLAFCLNHLLLKCLWNQDSSAQADFLRCFETMTSAYLVGVTWEPVERLEARAASLLPGLLLARVDGKSPVEYLTDEADKNTVRRCASALLRQPVERLTEISEAWRWALR